MHIRQPKKMLRSIVVKSKLRKLFRKYMDGKLELRSITELRKDSVGLSSIEFGYHLFLYLRVQI